MTDLLTLLCVVLMIGTAGSLDLDRITFGQAAAQLVVLMIACGVLQFIRARHQRRAYRQRINMQKRRGNNEKQADNNSPAARAV